MHRTSKAHARPWFAMTGLLAALAVVALAQDRPIRVEVQERFAAALKEYQKGELDKAAAALDEIIKMAPTSKEALILRERVGMDRLVKMLKDPQVGDAARIILRKAAEEARHIRRDPEEIRRLVEETGSDDVVTRWRAIRQLTATGPFAVPYLLDHALSEERPSEVSQKVAAVIAIRDMGGSATPALVMALRFADDPARARVAGLIADNADVRAIPPLLAIMEDPESPGFLKLAAERALARIFKDDKVSGTDKGRQVPVYPSAGEAYLRLALRYYYADPTLIEITPVDERVLWRWNAEAESPEARLTVEEVVPYVYARAMAEEILLEGMKQKSAPADLWELYVCNNYLQLEEALARSVAPDIPADEATEARERAARLETAHSINESLGSVHLYAALSRALKDGDTSLARRCVEALRNVGDPRPPAKHNTLVAALSYPDKLARVNAAETLMRLNPKGRLASAVEVARVMAIGLGVPPMETVVVLTGDDQLYAEMAGRMREWNIIAKHQKGAAETLKRLKDRVPPASLLVIDARTDGAAAETLVTSLRQDAETRRLPIIVLAPTKRMERLQKRCGTTATILPLEHEPATLKAALDAALSSDASPRTDHVRDNVELVSRILSTLADLPPGSRYPVRALGAAASGLIKNTPHDIRILALKAAGNLLATDGKNAVYSIYADAEEPIELRQEAGATLLRLLAASPELEADQRATLRRMSSDPDTALRAQAWHALAAAAVPREERLENLRGIATPGGN